MSPCPIELAKKHVMKRLVCIGFAEAISGPEVAWSLVDAGFQVVAFGRRGRRSALRHSRHVTTVEITAPESDCKSTVTELEDFLTSRNPSRDELGVLLPLDDAAVWVCNQAMLQSGWIVAGPRGSNATLALDKSLQNDAARGCGVAGPDTTYALVPEDVLRRADLLPLVLKPAMAGFVCVNRLRKGRNWICANQEELERAVAAWGGAWPVLVQPFIQGLARECLGWQPKTGSGRGAPIVGSG